MPNYCYYQMRVVGKKENVEEFVKIMQADYNYQSMKFDYEKHIGGRVFEASVDEFEEVANGIYGANISGDCAWSVLSCMFDGPYCYYNDIKEKYGAECRSTTVPIESERLNLSIEIYSEESGMCFQEHYLVKNGVVEIADCVDWYEYCVDEYETKEEAEKELEMEITEEEWETGQQECCFRRGGFDDWSFEI